MDIKLQSDLEPLYLIIELIYEKELKPIQKVSIERGEMNDILKEKTLKTINFLSKKYRNYLINNYFSQDALMLLIHRELMNHAKGD